MCPFSLAPFLEECVLRSCLSLSFSGTAQHITYSIEILRLRSLLHHLQIHGSNMLNPAQGAFGKLPESPDRGFARPSHQLDDDISSKTNTNRKIRLPMFLSYGICGGPRNPAHLRLSIPLLIERMWPGRARYKCI